MMKQFKLLCIRYIVLVISFTISIILVHFIPHNSIKGNIYTSAKTIENEGLYKQLLDFKLFQLDNFTDVLMLNIALSADSDKPIESAMLNNWNKSANYLDLAKDTKLLAIDNSKTLQKDSYGRYWQGYQIFLRPALCFFDYSQIRVLNYLVLSFFTALLLFLIYSKIGFKIMLFLLFSLLAINFSIVPLSMQFSNMFYVSFVATIVLLIKNEYINRKGLFYSYFFIVGGITSFMDFLTTPLITLGLPITIYILLNPKNNSVLYVIKASIIWFIGYSSIWISKWIIGWLLTGVNIFSAATEAATLRTSDIYKGMDMTIPNIISFIMDTLQSIGIFWPLIVISIVLIILYMISNKGIIEIKKNSAFLLIVLMFPVWLLILRNHTIQHGWFTWRTALVSIFPLLIFVWNTTDIRKMRQLSNTNKKETNV